MGVPRYRSSSSAALESTLLLLPILTIMEVSHESCSRLLRTLRLAAGRFVCEPRSVVFFEEEFTGPTLDPAAWRTEILTSGPRFCADSYPGRPGHWVDEGVECHGVAAYSPYGSATLVGWTARHVVDQWAGVSVPGVAASGTRPDVPAFGRLHV